VHIRRYLSLHFIFFVVGIISFALSIYTLAKVMKLESNSANKSALGLANGSANSLPVESENQTNQPTPSLSPTAQKNVDAVQKQLDQLQQQITTIKKQSVVVAPAKSQTKTSTLYIGSGSTDNRDWVLLPSATITIDPSQYSHIKEVRFEAGLSILNGEAHARLYDLTTSTPYFATEVSNNTSAGAWQTSDAFQIPNATHQYSVQIKSTSGEMATLFGSRLQIVSN